MARARGLPVPVRTLVAQPTLERIPHPSLRWGGGTGCVAWSYTLRRVPDEPDHPANLASLDAATRAALDVEPPWPRPAWMLDAVERLRRPMLWEAVATTWEPQGDRSVDAVLARHVASVAVNRFDEHRGPGARWDRAELGAAGAQVPAELVVDGVAVPGIVLDADRDVLGVGAALDDGAILTAALPRCELAHVHMAFETVVW